MSRTKITISIPDLDRKIRELEQSLERLRAVRAFAVDELASCDETAENAAISPVRGLHSNGWPRALHEVMQERLGVKMKVADLVQILASRRPDLKASDPQAVVRSTLNRLAHGYGYQREDDGREAVWWLPGEPAATMAKGEDVAV
ncbi:MAG: hypothetical protein ABL998_00590 [Planctomycetota bacterium]